jgi:uncharacterized delta-60 repeat protein
MKGHPRRTLLAGLACIAIAAVVPSIILVQHAPTTPKTVLASSAGTPDGSFAGTGVVVQPGSNGATGVAVIPAGLPAAGDSVVSAGDGTNFQVGRFTSAGRLDTSFRGGLIDSFSGQALAIAVVPAGAAGAGDVVAVGYQTGSICATATRPTFLTPVVAEYLPTGALNTGFAAGGIFRLPCPNPGPLSQGGEFNGVAIDGTGNVYAAGQAFGASNAGSTLVAAVSPNGSPLWSTTSLVGGTASQANAVAFSPVTNDVITVGWSLVGAQRYLTVSAFKNGTIDTTFSETGSAVASNRPGSAGGGVTVLPSGNVVAVGSYANTFLLAQYTSAGATDNSFGSGGQVTNSPNLRLTDQLNAVAYQPFGNVLVAAGFAGSGFGKKMVVTQYNATTGAPNLSFGSAGAAVHSSGSFSSSLDSVAVQSDGKTIGAGGAPVVNAVQGIGLIRVGGPTLSVGNLPLVQVTAFGPITLHFHASIDEPLFNAVSAVFCASAGAVLTGRGRCGSVTVPAGATQISVAVTAQVTVGPGQTQTVALAAISANGLAASPTHGLGKVAIQHLSRPQPYIGYRLVASDGGIFAFGTAPFLGSTGGIRLAQPIVGMTAVPHSKGYWLVARDGGIFAFGARFLGSTGNVHLTQPIVGMAATPTGKGYWLVAADGGIFSFGDARFFGSTGNLHLNQPIVGMAPTPDGRGYWLVARDGGIFSFGEARFLGSTGAIHLTKPIVGMAAYPGAPGYWLVASDGGIFSFGAALFHGSTGAIRLAQPIVGMASTYTGKGYWMVASDGGIFSFGDARFFGSTGAIHLNKPIVGMSG